MGVGHPLLDKALHQAERLLGTVCVLDGLREPLMVAEISSRVTDTARQQRRAMVGVSGSGGIYKLLRDWEVLRLVNQCNAKADASESMVGTAELAQWRDLATRAMRTQLGSMEFQLESMVVRETALLWPAGA